MTQTPEVRMNQAGEIAQRWTGADDRWELQGGTNDGDLITDTEVEGWTPLVPLERAQEAEDLASRTHEAMMAKYAEAAELRDALEALNGRMEMLAKHLEADAACGMYRGGSYAASVLVDVAQRIRRAL